jgi:glycosyltransferase involved in cell wall biosynthesis
MSETLKTIMHLIATNFYGGPEKQIVEHLSRFDTSCYRGILTSFLEGNNQNETLERAAALGLQNHGIPMSAPLDIRALWKLCKLLKNENVALLCTHGYKSTVMGWWVEKHLRIPVLAFSRGYTSENKKVAFYEWLERRVLGNLTGIIFVSESQKQRLKSFGISGRQSWVVRNAVKVGETQHKANLKVRRAVFDRLGIGDSSVMVVSAGRLSPEKGHRYLVDAIAKMGKSTNGSCFVFCGDGPCKKDLEKQARELGVWEKCRFPGFRHDINEIFQAMDLMVLPSLTEGLPNVVLEAFAWAKPVVASNVGGVPEVVEDGVNGLLILPGKPSLLANAIWRCLSAPELMHAMGIAGYHTVRVRFGFDAQAEKLERIYSELLPQRRSQSL